jgi:hypothetical protein
MIMEIVFDEPLKYIDKLSLNVFVPVHVLFDDTTFANVVELIVDNVGFIVDNDE